MNSRVKKALILCVSLVAIIAATGIVWIMLPYKRISDLDSRFKSTTRGMAADDVVNAMGGISSRTTTGSVAFWDDVRLGSDEDARVKSAICYKVKTFYLPVTFEFTFDEGGKLVGRHRFD